MKFRHEYKHVLTYSEYIALRNRLKVICKKDNNANENSEYLIRSLYFDNYNNKALMEKIDGVNRREKFRIRYYNDNVDFIRLEKKSKINGLCNKQSSNISKEQVQSIIDNKYEFLQNHSNELFMELYYKMTAQRLKPKVIVSYKREVFIYPAGNVRLTLDTDIRTGLSSLDFLNPNSPTIKAGNNILLEVKYDEFLPEFIRQTIQIGGRSHSAFSKYAASRMYY
ncbi:molecular chaperone [Epulopiscium sp. SCG-B10WGA-EpuloA2]|nr:molecular chaperone [Epulopiscium sp. SCG-B10WGA-EpuloA2]